MAEADNAKGAVKNFNVSGVERDSLRIDQLFKDEEADLTELVVTDNTGLCGTQGAVKMVETIGWYRFGPKQPGAVAWNVAEQAATDIAEGWNGLFESLAEKFNEAYPEENPYKHWGNPNKWVARGIMQELLQLYNKDNYADAGWHNGVPHLKLFNAGNLLFTSVLPHVTGMSFCMINYMEASQWTPNRGFYTSMKTLADYYPLNFKANADDGWKPAFYKNMPLTGFEMQWPYTAEKPVFDEAGEMTGTAKELCGDWILPFHMWNAGNSVKQYPILDANMTQDDMAKGEDVKITESFMKQQKYDFAGNIKYKLTKCEMSSDAYDGHRDIYIMGETNKEIICAGKFREGIMIVNFATKEYPKGEGRRPQMNKANSYRVKQFFGSMIEKGYLTTFGGDATAAMYKA